MREDMDMDGESGADVQQDRLWSGDGWTAKVVKNEDDDGWAVEMYLRGQPDPALVGPWTMGRDKKNPKPLDGTAFRTLVKTAKEFVGRTAQQARARLHREQEVGWAPERIFVHLDIVPEEDYPYAVLKAFGEDGHELGRQQVAADFKLNPDSAKAWIDSGYSKARQG